MATKLLDRPITMRAAPSSYLVLCGVWVLIALGYLALSLRNPSSGLGKGAAIAGTVAFLWWLWLQGFKIKITQSFLEYRDGFFKSFRIPLSEIDQLKDASIEWRTLGRRIRAPRLLVINNDQRVAISINTKPFRLADLQKIRMVIEKSG